MVDYQNLIKVDVNKPDVFSAVAVGVDIGSSYYEPHFNATDSAVYFSPGNYNLSIITETYPQNNEKYKYTFKVANASLNLQSDMVLTIGEKVYSDLKLDFPDVANLVYAGEKLPVSFKVYDDFGNILEDAVKITTTTAITETGLYKRSEKQLSKISKEEGKLINAAAANYITYNYIDYLSPVISLKQNEQVLMQDILNDYSDAYTIVLPYIEGNYQAEINYDFGPLGTGVNTQEFQVKLPENISGPIIQVIDPDGMIRPWQNIELWKKVYLNENEQDYYYEIANEILYTNQAGYCTLGDLVYFDPNAEYYVVVNGYYYDDSAETNYFKAEKLSLTKQNLMLIDTRDTIPVTAEVYESAAQKGLKQLENWSYVLPDGKIISGLFAWYDPEYPVAHRIYVVPGNYVIGTAGKFSDGSSFALFKQEYVKGQPLTVTFTKDEAKKLTFSLPEQIYADSLFLFNRNYNLGLSIFDPTADIYVTGGNYVGSVNLRDSGENEYRSYWIGIDKAVAEIYADQNVAVGSLKASINEVQADDNTLALNTTVSDIYGNTLWSQEKVSKVEGDLPAPEPCAVIKTGDKYYQISKNGLKERKMYYYDYNYQPILPEVKIINYADNSVSYEGYANDYTGLNLINNLTLLPGDYQLSFKVDLGALGSVQEETYNFSVEEGTAVNNSISGTVKLKYKDSTVGTVVYLTYQADDPNLATTYVADLQADGKFNFTDLMPGTYELKVQSPGYLTYKTTFTVTNGMIDLGTITLIPGDLDGSGQVDLTDILLLAKYYKKSALDFAAADLNGDGVIDIFDLVILAKHYAAKY